MADKRTIALDFDAVLHSYEGKYSSGKLNGPIKGAKSAVDALLDAGFEVIILSARDSMEIKKWLKEHDFPSLKVTNEKVPFQVMLDDRAVQFNGNWTPALVEKLKSFKAYWE